MSYNIEEYIEMWMNDGYTRKDILDKVDEVFDKGEQNEINN